MYRTPMDRLDVLDMATIKEMLQGGLLVEVTLNDDMDITVVSQDKGTTYGIVDYDTYIRLQDEKQLKLVASNWRHSHYMGADYYDEYTNHGHFGNPPICSMKQQGFRADR